LAEIEHRLPAGSIPAEPLRILVPSHALREHLLARLLERRRAWLGLEVATLSGIVATVLDNCGERLVSGELVETLLVARLAARESALARTLGGLVRGYEQVAGAVRDLLDAGFVEEHLDACVERLEAERGTVGGATVERAIAIVRVAAGLRPALAELGLVTAVELTASAARCLAADAERALPASAVLVHGFADATGVASDLLEAIVRHRNTTVFIDRPPSFGVGRWRFGARLIERLAGCAPVEEDAAAAVPARIHCLRAADPARQAEAAVAWLAAPDAGEPSERDAIVARNLSPQAVRLLAQLDRQGIAGSLPSGLESRLGRRIAALLRIVELRGQAPVGTLLEAADAALEARSGVPLADLRVALGLLGARTLRAAAELRPPGRPLRLLVADRIAPDPERDRSSARPREISATSLGATLEHVSHLDTMLHELESPRRLTELTSILAALLAATLPLDEAEVLAAALEPLREGAAGALEVSPEEMAPLLERVWSDLFVAPAGRGGGVALLSVTEARGRTFRRLALVDLARDHFPRPVRADPLLPDPLRQRLRELLPDLPVKLEGHDEERFLFAQLLAAAEQIALLRPAVDEAGKAVSPSSLLDELLRNGHLQETPAPVATRPSAFDAAVAAALKSGDAGLTATLPAAIVEARTRWDALPAPASRGADGPAELADARVAVVRELGADPSRPSAHGLGPYFGEIGATGFDDPRRVDPSVTALERFAACGWQCFLERLLRLRPLPDLTDSLPSLPRRLVGSVVHAVLEELVSAAEPPPLQLADAVAGPDRVVAWPSREELERRTGRAAARQLTHEALDPAIFGSTISREAVEMLEVARQLDWPEGVRTLLTAEADGEARFAAAGKERRLRFRVDRVERDSAQLLLTDYKSGRPISSAVRADTRLRHLASAVARGEALQLPAYLLALGGAPARARYLYLDPRLDPRLRELGLTSEELEHGACDPPFDILYAAWDEGAFLPRLLEPDLQKAYSGCAYCEVREACLQGDSGARLRVERWAARGGPGSSFDRTARAWWGLRDRAPVGGETA